MTTEFDRWKDDLEMRAAQYGPPANWSLAIAAAILAILVLRWQSIG